MEKDTGVRLEMIFVMGPSEEGLAEQAREGIRDAAK